MINISVFSEEKAWSKKIKKKDFFFKKICKSFPKKYKFNNKKISFTLLLSNNKNIKKLNKNFRKKNKHTDILSFPFSKKTQIKNKAYIGDMIISYNYVDKPDYNMNELVSVIEKKMRLNILCSTTVNSGP